MSNNKEFGYSTRLESIPLDGVFSTNAESANSVENLGRPHRLMSTGDRSENGDLRRMYSAPIPFGAWSLVCFR